jgi:hypothetical protein
LNVHFNGKITVKGFCGVWFDILFLVFEIIGL